MYISTPALRGDNTITKFTDCRICSYVKPWISDGQNAILKIVFLFRIYKIVFYFFFKTVSQRYTLFCIFKILLKSNLTGNKLNISHTHGTQAVV